MTILLGNTYPPALVRRRVVITPITLEAAIKLLANGFESFWGHTNTIQAANEQLGVDVRPKTERPAVILDKEGFPSLNGIIATKVLVLSPNYANGFRPQIGEEVPLEKLTGWQCLLWEWE